MPEPDLWEVTDHVCRLCFGRLLRRVAAGVTTVRCAQCDTEVTGRVETLCACGAKLPNGRLAGLACRVNPAPTLEQSARVVVVFVGEVAVPRPS